MMLQFRMVLALITYISFAAGISAQEVLLFETFESGKTHFVDCRVSLTGELQVPIDEGKTQKVSMKGESTIRYDERLLPFDEKLLKGKTLRIYRKIDLQRKIGDQPQEANLRREVSRVVVAKSQSAKLIFSPDGPMLFGELDLIRTDLFVPALQGMLSTQAVRPGDRWKVDDLAVRELTDMETEEGSLQMTYLGETSISGRKLAHLKFSGELKGLNEDGPVKQILSGTVYFDLEDRFMSYLSLRGEQILLDKDRKPVGKIEGELVLTRRLKSDHPDLRDAVVRGMKLDPTDENTALVYENPDLGVKFVHSRKWRVNRVQGRQITLDESNGNGLLITVEPKQRVPTTDQFLRESKDLLTQRKAKIADSENPVRLSKSPVELDRFAFQTEMGEQRVWMDYYVARQPQGGACFAARLIDTDRNSLRKEVERIARSFVITRPLETK